MKVILRMIPHGAVIHAADAASRATIRRQEKCQSFRASDNKKAQPANTRVYYEAYYIVKQPQTPEEKMAVLSELIFSGKKIHAIKLYHELTGEGLKEAKDKIEALEASLRQTSPEKFVSGTKGKGCVGVAAVFCLGSAVLIYWIIKVI